MVDDTPVEVIKSLFCDIFGTYAADSLDSRTSYKPFVLRHITLAFYRSRNAALSVEQAGDLVREMASDPKCSPLHNQLPGSLLDLPSISVMVIGLDEIGTVVQDLDPRLIISVEREPLAEKARTLAKFYGTEKTFINMPERDLAHAGWIFSMPLQAIKGEFSGLCKKSQ